MIVCHCKSKTDRDIKAAAASGARTAREVTDACSAGGECGGCLRAITQLLTTAGTRRADESQKPPRR